MLEKRYHDFESLIVPKSYFKSEEYKINRGYNNLYRKNHAEFKKTQKNEKKISNILNKKEVNQTNKDKEIINSNYINNKLEGILNKINTCTNFHKQNEEREDDKKAQKFFNTVQECFDSNTNRNILNSKNDANLETKIFMLPNNKNLNDLDTRALCEIITNEKKKNMNLRLQLSELREKLDYLEKKSETQEKNIESLKREKVADSNYLLKLEKMLVDKQKENFESFGKIQNNRNLINQSEITQNYLKSIRKLSEENKFLNEFKHKIFEISKTTDEINKGLIESLKDLCKNFKEVKKILQSENFFLKYNMIPKIQSDFEEKIKQSIIDNTNL